jgi:hypothetical protein
MKERNNRRKLKSKEERKTEGRKRLDKQILERMK